MGLRVGPFPLAMLLGKGSMRSGLSIGLRPFLRPFLRPAPTRSVLSIARAQEQQQASTRQQADSLVEFAATDSGPAFNGEAPTPAPQEEPSPEPQASGEGSGEPTHAAAAASNSVPAGMPGWAQQIPGLAMLVSAIAWLLAKLHSMPRWVQVKRIDLGSLHAAPASTRMQACSWHTHDSAGIGLQHSIWKPTSGSAAAQA